MLAEDPQRTVLFFEFAKKARSSPWDGFVNLLNRPNSFVIHQVETFCLSLPIYDDAGTRKFIFNRVTVYNDVA